MYFTRPKVQRIYDASIIKFGIFVLFNAINALQNPILLSIQKNI